MLREIFKSLKDNVEIDDKIVNVQKEPSQMDIK